jgi:hypothetical protein
VSSAFSRGAAGPPRPGYCAVALILSRLALMRIFFLSAMA